VSRPKREHTTELQRLKVGVQVPNVEDYAMLGFVCATTQCVEEMQALATSEDMARLKTGRVSTWHSVLKAKNTI
jgi:hypothetical protein